MTEDRPGQEPGLADLRRRQGRWGAAAINLWTEGWARAGSRAQARVAARAATQGGRPDMGFMDKIREQGTQLTQKAQETAREGKIKLDQAQAKRRADAIFRDLGAAVYAERTGRASAENKEKIDRLVDALSRQEAEQGLGDANGTTPPA